jgi:hypothetical protein
MPYAGSDSSQNTGLSQEGKEGNHLESVLIRHLGCHCCSVSWLGDSIDINFIVS